MPGQEAGGNRRGRSRTSDFSLGTPRLAGLRASVAGSRSRNRSSSAEMRRPQRSHELQGNQAAEKCAAVSPGKAPSVTKTIPPRTQKPAAKVQKPAVEVKLAAPSKTQESWQPWHSTASGLTVALLAALVAMSGSGFGLVDATSLALAGGAQSARDTQAALYA